MASSKKGSGKNTEKYLLKLTARSALCWFFVFVGLMVWIFFLGVFVGRGNLPFNLLNPGSRDVREPAGEQGVPDRGLNQRSVENPEFDFYDVLSSKKQEAAKKHHPAVRSEKPPRTSTPTSRVKPARVAKPARTGHGYALQVGSFRERSRAMKLVARLTDKGYPVFCSRTEVNEKIYYRVVCGPFKNEKQAHGYKKNLSDKEGIPALVIKTEK